MECLERSSKQTIESMPRSLVLSAIDTPIMGNIKDKREDEDEWEDRNKEYQTLHKVLILVNIELVDIKLCSWFIISN